MRNVTPLNNKVNISSPCRRVYYYFLDGKFLKVTYYRTGGTSVDNWGFGGFTVLFAFQFSNKMRFIFISIIILPHNLFRVQIIDVYENVLKIIFNLALSMSKFLVLDIKISLRLFLWEYKFLRLLKSYGE